MSESTPIGRGSDTPQSTTSPRGHHLDRAGPRGIKHVGRLWDPRGVLFPNGQVLGEISPEGVRMAGLAHGRLEH